MRSISLRGLALIASLASVSEAQNIGEGSPILFGKSVSKTELVRAVRSCDTKALRPSCADFVGAAKKFLPPLGLANAEQVANYLSGLVEKPCPSGSRYRSTEWVPANSAQPGQIILAYGVWNCRAPGERLLWDGDKPVISLFDGNFIVSYMAPQVRLAAVAPPRPSAARQQSRVPSDTPPGRMTTSQIRVPISKREVARVDTVYSVRHDTVTNTIVKEVARVDTVWMSRKGFPWWRVLGGVAAASLTSCGVVANNYGFDWWSMKCGPPRYVPNVNVNVGQHQHQ